MNRNFECARCRCEIKDHPREWDRYSGVGTGISFFIDRGFYRDIIDDDGNTSRQRYSKPVNLCRDCCNELDAWIFGSDANVQYIKQCIEQGVAAQQVYNGTYDS